MVLSFHDLWVADEMPEFFADIFICTLETTTTIQRTQLILFHKSFEQYRSSTELSCTVWNWWRILVGRWFYLCFSENDKALSLHFCIYLQISIDAKLPQSHIYTWEVLCNLKQYHKIIFHNLLLYHKRGKCAT